MAGVTIDPKPVKPQSTGAVAFDPDPVTTVHVVDNASTGAVPYAAPGETRSAYYQANAAELETKVITPPPVKPTKAPKTAETK